MRARKFQWINLCRFVVCLQDGESAVGIEMEGESHTTVDSLVMEGADANGGDLDLEDIDLEDIDLEDVELLIDTDYTGPLKPTVEAAIQAKWSKIMGPGVEIVVSGTQN